MRRLTDLITGENPLREFRTVAFEPDLDMAPCRVRSLTELERSEYEGYSLDSEGKFDPNRAAYASAYLILISVCDEQGNLLYNEEQLEQIARLPERVSTAILDAIVDLRRGLKKKLDNSAKTNS